MEKGMVSLVGAGCGDPDFLTIKAQKRLRSCDVLIYDSLVSERILEETPADCEKIYVGKRYGRHAMKQEEINALLIGRAQEGKRVVRLKGGDPYVFGRGGEEFLALAEAGIVCEEIPGITSCIAVPAAAGIPVTHRGISRSFTVVTGTAAKEDGRESVEMDFDTLAKLNGTLVILMGMHHLKEIAAGLMKAGMASETPCAVIMEGTTEEQRCARAQLSEIAARAEEEQLKSPAVIVVGAAARMELTAPAEKRTELTAPAEKRAELRAPAEKRTELTAFAETKSLSGITVGVTGTPHFAAKLSGALREAGALVRDMSFMEIRETGQALPDLQRYGWLVFTSPNGVRIFLEKMKKEKRDLRRLVNPIAVIGTGTAKALEEAGIYADYMPQSYDVVHLAEGLTERILAEAAHKREEGPAAKPALFLRASNGSEALPRLFKEKGLAFTEFPLYEIDVNERKREQAVRHEPDYVVFGAGSGVRAYFDGIAKWGGASGQGQKGLTDDGAGQNVLAQTVPRYVCMGEACAGVLAQYAKGSFLAAKESSIAGIVECICADVQGTLS